MHDDAQGETRQYLRDDPSLSCGSEDHAATLIWAFCLITLWPIGVPGMYSGLLAVCRTTIAKREYNWLSSASALLWADYETHCFFWEPVDLLRRLTLTGFVIPIKSAFQRVLIALFVSIGYLMAQIVSRPYKRKADSLLSILISVSLIWCNVFALLAKMCESSSELCTEFGLGTGSERLFLAFLFLWLATLVVLMAAGLYLLAHTTATAGGIKLKATGKPPGLHLAPGVKYHLFISHVWATGQDQVHALAAHGEMPLPLCP